MKPHIEFIGNQQKYGFGSQWYGGLQLWSQELQIHMSHGQTSSQGASSKRAIWDPCWRATRLYTASVVDHGSNADTSLPLSLSLSFFVWVPAPLFFTLHAGSPGHNLGFARIRGPV